MDCEQTTSPQQQRRRQQQQQQLQPLRDTCTSCDFCTKERLRCCDVLLPRGSLDVKTSNPHCHNHRKNQPARSKRKEATPSQHSGSISRKGIAGSPQFTPDGDMAAAPRVRSASGASRVLPLKRCRLSASPATGLVGMQENAFLSDYFECLGFFPLASGSLVRQAMVNIMLGCKPQIGQEGLSDGTDDRVRRGQAVFSQQGSGGSWSNKLACQDRTDYPLKCIFWCAIALGALVQGCSSEFVTGYVKHARDSLVECFDGTTVETARAYLVTAFLFRFLGDEESNRKYLAFANSIVQRLPQDTIPLKRFRFDPTVHVDRIHGMANMILAQMDTSRFIRPSCGGSNGEGKGKEKPAHINHIPTAQTFVHELDLCNFYFFAGQYMQKAFLEDIRTELQLANIMGEVGGARKRQTEGGSGECQERVKGRTVKGTIDWDGHSLEAPLRSSDNTNEPVTSRHRKHHTPAGGAIKAYIKDVLPEMAIRLAAIERPGTCSAVGRFALHSCMAYMNVVKGEMRSAFKSIKVCAEVLVRFPGICRYRPHVVHSILTAAASSMCGDVYDPVREIYNSILPLDGTLVPPMEEWGGMKPICNNVFCRSLLAESNNLDFESNNLGFSHKRAIAASVPARR